MYIQHKHKADTTFFIFTSKRFVYLHIFDIHMKELVNTPNGNVLFFLVHVSWLNILYADTDTRYLTTNTRHQPPIHEQLITAYSFICYNINSKPSNPIERLLRGFCLFLLLLEALEMIWVDPEKCRKLPCYISLLQ